MKVELSPQEIEFIRAQAAAVKRRATSVIGCEGDSEFPNGKNIREAKQDLAFAKGLLEKLDRR